MTRKQSAISAVNAPPGDTVPVSAGMGVGGWLVIGLGTCAGSGMLWALFATPNVELFERLRLVLRAGVIGLLVPTSLIALAFLALIVILAVQQILYVVRGRAGVDLTGPREIQLVHVPDHGPTINAGIPGDTLPFHRRDLGWLLDYAWNNPAWSARLLNGAQLPSGRVMRNEDYKAFCETLARFGLLDGHGPRARGDLVGDLDHARETLRC